MDIITGEYKVIVSESVTTFWVDNLIDVLDKLIDSAILDNWWSRIGIFGLAISVGGWVWKNF